jgi:transposase
MRGTDQRSDGLFSYLRPESRIPKNHPLRQIRSLTDAALRDLSADFEALYARCGRPSIPPEKLLRALLLQAFYSIRSERQLMEQLDYNLLFRWFVGLSVDEPVWDPTVFSKNRGSPAARRYRGRVPGRGAEPGGSEAIAVNRAFHRRRHADPGLGVAEERPAQGWQGPAAGPGRNGTRDFHEEKQSNKTHALITDADARLARKGRARKRNCRITAICSWRTATGG